MTRGSSQLFLFLATIVEAFPRANAPVFLVLEFLAEGALLGVLEFGGAQEGVAAIAEGLDLEGFVVGVVGFLVIARNEDRGNARRGSPGWLGVKYRRYYSFFHVRAADHDFQAVFRRRLKRFVVSEVDDAVVFDPGLGDFGFFKVQHLKKKIVSV